MFFFRRRRRDEPDPDEVAGVSLDELEAFAEAVAEYQALLAATHQALYELAVAEIARSN